MKRRMLNLGLLPMLALVLVSCTETPQTPENVADATTVPDTPPAEAAVQNWSLWDALSSYNTSVWTKTNGVNNDTFFGCGWVPGNASIANGLLTLKLTNVSSWGRTYSSGEYKSNNTFTYGTFETNMKAASGSGLVTSFFTYTGNPWDEIDIEILGKNPWQAQLNFYVSGSANHEKIIDLGFDASAGFHKYAIEWGNGYINWYVDGKWVHGVNNTGFNLEYGHAMPSNPMQMMVNLWPGIGLDSWLGTFTYTGTKYAYYDYFKYTPK